jgi:hypothetical protein
MALGKVGRLLGQQTKHGTSAKDDSTHPIRNCGKNAEIALIVTEISAPCIPIDGDLGRTFQIVKG